MVTRRCRCGIVERALSGSWAAESRLPLVGRLGLTRWVAQALHSDEIPINAELVRALVRRAMPDHAEAPVRRSPSSGSTNALFRLGDDLLVRLPRQPGGSATIAKEGTWLPLLGPQLPVSVPDIVAMFEPDDDYPERWSSSAGSKGSTLRWSGPIRPSTQGGRTWPGILSRFCAHSNRRRSQRRRSAAPISTGIEAIHWRGWTRRPAAGRGG